MPLVGASRTCSHYGVRTGPPPVTYQAAKLMTNLTVGVCILGTQVGPHLRQSEIMIVVTGGRRPSGSRVSSPRLKHSPSYCAVRIPKYLITSRLPFHRRLTFLPLSIGIRRILFQPLHESFLPQLLSRWSQPQLRLGKTAW